MLCLFLATFAVGFQRFAYPVEQLLVAKRLLDEVDGAFLHRLDSHRYVAMTGDEDDWQGIAAPNQFFLQFEPTEAGHTNVEYEAAGFFVGGLFEEFVGGTEDFVAQVHGVHQCLHGEANGRVIVNDKNRGCWIVLLHHADCFALFFNCTGPGGPDSVEALPRCHDWNKMGAILRASMLN